MDINTSVCSVLDLASLLFLQLNDPRDLSNARRVCKLWDITINQEEFWKKVSQKRWGADYQISKEKSWQLHFKAKLGWENGNCKTQVFKLKGNESRSSLDRIEMIDNQAHHIQYNPQITGWTVIVTNLPTGKKELYRIGRQERGVTSIALNPHDLILSLGSNRVQIFNRATGQQKHHTDEFANGERDTNTVRLISSDEKCFVTAVNNVIKIWDLAPNKDFNTIHTRHSHISEAQRVDHLLIMAGKGPKENEINLLNISSQKTQIFPFIPYVTDPLARTINFKANHIAANAQYLAGITAKGKVKVWNLKERQFSKTLWKIDPNFKKEDISNKNLVETGCALKDHLLITSFGFSSDAKSKDFTIIKVQDISKKAFLFEKKCRGLVQKILFSESELLAYNKNGELTVFNFSGVPSDFSKEVVEEFSFQSLRNSV